MTPWPNEWMPYCGKAPVPPELFARWNFDPVVMLVLASGMFLLARSAPRLRPAGMIGLALAFLLFISPFCALTSALYSARVAHHVVLTGMVAPLLVVAVPALRARSSGPLALWVVVHALFFWLWHLPSAYAWALSDDAAYWVMQGTLLGSAVGLWAAVARASAPQAVAGLLATMVQMGLLGALITFAAVPLYAPHWLTTISWGLSPLEDQQLAGLLMWVPGAGIYLGAALFRMWGWMGGDRQETA